MIELSDSVIYINLIEDKLLKNTTLLLRYQQKKMKELNRSYEGYYGSYY
jgi:hypothetical protein